MTNTENQSPERETPRTHAALMLASDADGAREVCELCEELERENIRLLEAAKMALHEMRHTNAPRNSFTEAVDALDAAITASTPN